MLRHTWSGNIRELENCLERAFIVCHDTVIRPEHLPREVGQGPNHIPGMASALPDVPGARELDRSQVLDALVKTDWNVAKSARLLGIARNTLYQRIRIYKLDRPE